MIEDLFEKLKACDGSYVDEDGSLYSLLGEHELEAINGIQIIFPETDNSILGCWEKLGYWLDELELYPEDFLDVGDDWEEKKPLDYYSSVEEVKEIVIQYMLDKDRFDDKHSVYYWQLEHNNDAVFVILGNGHLVDGWALGQIGCYLVTSDIDSYIAEPDNGIYARQKTFHHK